MTSQPIAVMQRYEMKYLMDAQQTAYIKQALAGHMTPDEYGLTSIASLYYDTPDDRLIRASTEHAPFKEKIRLRSYGLATASSPVFLELKRKAQGIVYKRRVQSTVAQVQRFFGGDTYPGNQIHRELTYFRDHYRNLVPACLMIYDREAYRAPEHDVRLTVDYRPRYRTERLDLTTSLDGTALLPEGSSILEIKVQQSVPLWLTKILDEGQIRKTSFSKYGTAYKQQLADAKKERIACYV